MATSRARWLHISLIRSNANFWNFDDVDSLNSFQDGVVPWFGNTQARPGRFGGQGSGGNSNVDIRADIDNPQLGTAFGDINFATGQSDSMTIDLTNGSGLTTEVIKTILSEWVAGNNAGIGFADSTSSAFGLPAEDQIFFQSNDVPAGNSVDSTVNGCTGGIGSRGSRRNWKWAWRTPAAASILSGNRGLCVRYWRCQSRWFDRSFGRRSVC